MTRQTPLQEAPHGAPGKGFRLATFDSLRHRDYRFLFFSIMFTSAGQWMQSIALNWVVYDMTGSPFMLGLINGVRGFSFLIIGPWSGVMADRFDRKKLMWFSQLWVMFLSGVVTVLIVMNRLEVWHLIVFTLCSAAGESLTQPVRQALIPSIVPRSTLMNAVALQSAAFNSMRIIGPTIGGLLLVYLGAGWVFGIKTALYIVVLTLLAMLVVPALPARETPRSAGHDLLEGFKYIKANDAAFWLILLAIIPMVFAFPFQSLMPVFARDILQGNADGYGILVSFIGAGALAGTLTVASMGEFSKKGLLLLVSGCTLGLSLLLFSRSEWFPLSLFLATFIGASQQTYMSMTNTLLHMNITDEMRGRVMSIYMLDHGLTPIGTLAAGAAASVWDAPLAVSLMGTAMLGLGLVALLRVPLVRRLA